VRQLLVQVPADAGARVMALAGRFEAVNVACLGGTGPDGAAVAVVLLHVSNAVVGPLLDALEALPELRVSMLPTGALALRPPADEAPDQVTDVTARSPLEVFVAGLQSIGSWTGFLGYAVAGGVVVWLGLLTNTVYLLVGAMLIAPFAGPAINTAIATARGDLQLLWHSVVRYVAALAVTAAVTALLSLAFGQGTATTQMAAVSSISGAAVLLPLTAGAAGALHLSQGAQSSLVSGAAAGMLIAASLAPPAGLVGMAAVSGDHAMIAPALFLLGLQLVGINVGGTLVFWRFGLTPRGVRFARGRDSVRWTALGVTAAGLAALLWWQFGSGRPTLQRSTVEQRMRDVVLAALATDSTVGVVAADLRFTRASIPGQHSLLVELHVQPRPGVEASDSVLAARAAARTRAAVGARAADVTPLVSVTVVRP
jgi:uncharacterized hydrophobic protein (TIGR00271 family)